MGLLASSGWGNTVLQANLGAKNHACVMPDADKDATLNAITGGPCVEWPTTYVYISPLQALPLVPLASAAWRCLSQCSWGSPRSGSPSWLKRQSHSR